MRDELYQKVHKAAAERFVNTKVTGRHEKINLLDAEESRRHFYTIGLSTTTNLKYDLVTTSKRRPELISKLLDVVIDRLKQQDQHWNALRGSKQRFEFTIPAVAGIDGRLYDCRVGVEVADYDSINHEMVGLLHAIYGTSTNLARVKILDMPNENKA